MPAPIQHTDAAVIATRLADAEEALHQFMMGNRNVEVQFDGRRQRVSEVNQAGLQAYIASLRQQLAVLNGQGSRTFVIECKRGLEP